MSLAVACDICGQRHDVKSAAEGRAVKCRQCGVEFLVCPENHFRDRQSEEEDEPAGNPLWAACRGVASVTVTVVSLAVMIGLVFQNPRTAWMPVARAATTKSSSRSVPSGMSRPNVKPLPAAPLAAAPAPLTPPPMDTPPVVPTPAMPSAATSPIAPPTIRPSVPPARPVDVGQMQREMQQRHQQMIEDQRRRIEDLRQQLRQPPTIPGNRPTIPGPPSMPGPPSGSFAPKPPSIP